MPARPALKPVSPTRSLATFALFPLLAMAVLAGGWTQAVGAPSLTWAIALAASGTLALASGLRVDQRRGPLNAALLVSQIAGLAAAMVAISASHNLGTSHLGWAVVTYTAGLMHLALGILIALQALPATRR